jgi:glycosyltransferase involved in cell wall biosynthesis
MSSHRQTAKKVLMLLPSLRISGGVREAIRLAENLSSQGISIEIVTFWKSEHVLPSHIPVHHLSNFAPKRATAALQYPLLLFRFFLFLRSFASDQRKLALVLTHFSTYPFAWIAPAFDWYCFNQDAEWMFAPRSFMQRLILATCRHSRVLTTNTYLETLFEESGIKSIGTFPVWPDTTWLTTGEMPAREIDVVMLLRKGRGKRMDLYLEILRLATKRGLSSCVITPDLEIFTHAAPLASEALLRPSQEEFIKIYRRSKVFLLLSEAEGFSLPPLEAMGSGCVPLCRDSGGPRCYMTGPLAGNLVPLQASSDEIFDWLQRLLADPVQLSALSVFATEQFITGVDSCILQRNECIASLTAMLHEN